MLPSYAVHHSDCRVGQHFTMGQAIESPGKVKEYYISLALCWSVLSHSSCAVDVNLVSQVNAYLCEPPNAYNINYSFLNLLSTNGLVA